MEDKTGRDCVRIAAANDVDEVCVKLLDDDEQKFTFGKVCNLGACFEERSWKCGVSKFTLYTFFATCPLLQVFDKSSSQTNVYNAILKPMIHDVFLGYALNYICAFSG